MTVPAEIAASKQISLTTYRKDGTPVATPVWHVADGKTITTVSAADAWKVKRLRRNPQVEIVACDIRGKVAPDAHPIQGTATLLAPSETETARRLLESRYITARIGGGLSRLLRLKRPPGIGIVITL
ncbi:PPOX class F420-dependent oxidoreductase [Amorphoplanes digitatis]|uniref:PPOX class probable F420-dependent enzyme n=1 Tax=Actinoplanes digitatis TaxID=1868 RepID=A0A7W7HZ08_9ACTN|nr:PPOX class F420-dependent oxidoreductase [Actinoplanes digitatis]MBB4763304.1 PPOX class probable F420-dependent enzyme [Actinoplanes digitatis]GID92123.1 PPOX class F420-dependent oxidoreductase [Actinoplanes digitatis]